MNNNKILEQLLRLFPFVSEEHILLLLGTTHILNLKKGETFIKQGEVKARVGLILTGLVRSYYLKEGEEKTMLFFSKYHLVVSHECIVMAKSSSYTFEALEDTTLIVIDYYELQKLQLQHPDILYASYDMLKQYVSMTLNRIEAYIVQTPEERYLRAINEIPDIMHRVSQKHLASYLGITPVSLSRIKARIMHRRKKKNNEKNDALNNETKPTDTPSDPIST